VCEESVGLNGLGNKGLKRIHSGAELGEVAKGNIDVVWELLSSVWHVVLMKFLVSSRKWLVNVVMKMILG